MLTLLLHPLECKAVSRHQRSVVPQQHLKSERESRKIFKISGAFLIMKNPIRVTSDKQIFSCELTLRHRLMT